MFDVLVGGGARDGEADDEDVGLRVRQRPQPVVLLLTRRVPQVQTDGPAVDRHLNARHTHLVRISVSVLCNYDNKNLLVGSKQQTELQKLTTRFPANYL